MAQGSSLFGPAALSGLHDDLWLQGMTVQQALEAFRADYAPVLKVRVRRRQPALDAPSAFLKQR